MNLQEIKKYIKLLDISRSQTPQKQLEIVRDIKRRCFLRDVLDVVLLGTVATTCCAVPNEYSPNLPDIGDSDRSNLSPREADFLGNKVIHDIENKGSMLNDYDVIAYLNDVGGNLASYSALAGARFNFYLVRDNIINAFALPGGYICLYNGLIYTTRSEAELTSVMSHEIGHVVQHHIFRNISGYKRNQWVSLAGVLSGALLATVNPGAAVLAMQGSQGLATQNMLSNSRDFEREADRVGQHIMYNAGFDPHAMPEFFKRLKDTTKFNDNEAFEFLRTHPVTSQRISEAETRANHLHTKMRPDSHSFLLSKEKCRVRQLGIVNSIKFYENALKTQKYSFLDTQLYGLAFAKYVEDKFIDAAIILEKIKIPEFKNHPAVIGLKALVMTDRHDFTNAFKTFEDGLSNYPSYKTLWLGKADLYLKFKKYKNAENYLEDLSQNYPNDIDVWIRLAKIYSDSIFNNVQKYHYALGNKVYLMGKYQDALTQYKIAYSHGKGKKVDTNLNEVLRRRIAISYEMWKTEREYGG
jgi:beta-barrel assembly-enhancing protease